MNNDGFFFFEHVRTGRYLKELKSFEIEVTMKEEILFNSVFKMCKKNVSACKQFVCISPLQYLRGY